MRGNAVPELQGRQKSCGKAQIDRAIDQCDRGVDGGNDAERGEHSENGQGHSRCREREQRRRKKDCGDGRDRRQIAAEAGGSVEPRRPASHGQAVGDRLFESAAPAREQDVSSVSSPRLLRCRGFSFGLFRRKHGRAGDIELRTVRAARKIFDRAAVKRPRRKIHALEIAVAGKNSVDEAKPLEQLLPVDIGNQPQAGDDVANRDIRRPLLAMDITHHQVGRRVLDGHSLIEPGQRGRDPRILIAQPMHELDREGLGKRFQFLRSEDDRDRLSRRAACAQQSVSQTVGSESLAPGSW